MGLPQALRAFANGRSGYVLEAVGCCARPDGEWATFLARVATRSEEDLMRETELPASEDRDGFMSKYQATAEADRMIRDRTLSARKRARLEQSRLQAIERRKIAARVTARQTAMAMKFLERKAA